MDMVYYPIGTTSYEDIFKLLEADIQHANALAAAIPRGKGGARLHMTLVYADGRCKVPALGRKATISDFYAVILPSLQSLHNNLVEMDITRNEKPGKEVISKERLYGDTSLSNVDLEREAECGICLEPCPKIVLPHCLHSMCINCYRDWNSRSEACPFCRGSIKRVMSRDLWVLTCADDVIETDTVLKQDLERFYMYIGKLPKDTPDTLFFMYYEYLI